MNLSASFQNAFSPAIRKVLDEVSRVADEKGRRAVLVGGVVRDMLLKVPSGDADVMFEHPAKPLVDELAKSLKAKAISHERFLTFTLQLSDGLKLDIVTAREETYAKPGELPKVTPAKVEQDLKRRDFTINAIACVLNKQGFGDTLDPFGGEKDLKAKLVRALHAKSFEDDPTRLFRAARFAARLGFQVERETELWIVECIKANRPASLTPVRRRHEFELVLKEKDPMPALRLLEKWGVLGQIHPAWGRVGTRGLKFSPEPDFEGRLAAWFGRWAEDQVKKMMTDLSFEKTIKRNVLSKHVQSPSTS